MEGSEDCASPEKDVCVKQTNGGADEASHQGLDKLYKIYDELNSAGDKAELEWKYRELLTAVKGSEKEKRLASQFITRFVDCFPNLEQDAVNALFDLLEDEDVCIRKQSEKDLVTVCKKLPHLVAQVADVLAQVLATVNTGELNLIQACLTSLFFINGEQALLGIFAQIRTGEDAVMERCWKFLQTKIKGMGQEIRTDQFEARLLSEIVKSAKSVKTKESFLAVSELINITSKAKTDKGGKSVVRIIELLLDIKKDLPSDEDEIISKLLICTDFVFPFFHQNSGNSSASLFVYYCTKVLPTLKDIPARNEDLYNSVLRLAVDLSLYFEKLEDSQNRNCILNLIRVAQDFLKEPCEGDAVPDYQFGFIESLFYLIHKLGFQNPKAFNDLPSELLKNFQTKVGYLLRATIAYSVKLRDDLKNVKWDEIRKEDIKITCLRALTNVTTMGKDFYRKTGKEPWQSQIRLSWKVLSGGSRSTPAKKRPVSATDDVRRPDIGRKVTIYRPPSGKFSDRAGYYNSPKRYNPPSPRIRRVRRDGGVGRYVKRVYNRHY